MYEDLIKQCRGCLDSLCGECKYEHLQNAGNFVRCMNALLGGAADAIEGLNKAYQMMAEAYETEVTKERWIPVTERLPKTRDSILGQKSSKVIVAFHFDDGTQGTDTAHTLNGIWVFEDHITVVRRTVTHWMPLPSAPTEET